MSDYNGVRDQLTEQSENSNLRAGNQFWYDSGGLNIGFGYNLTAQIGTTTDGAVARAALAAAGLTFTNPQWNAIIAAAQSPAATSGPATSLNSSVGTAATITVSEATTLMDNYYTSIVVPIVDTWVDPTTTPPQVLAGLEDLIYNASSAFTTIPNLSTDVADLNWGGAAYDIAFNTGTQVPNRRIDEALLMLGFDPQTEQPLNGTSVDLKTLITFEQGVAATTFTGTLTAAQVVQQEFVNGTDPTEIENSSLLTYLIPKGYYVVQPADSSSTIISTLTTDGMSVSVTEPTLLRINAPFGVTGISTGALLHVPVAASTISAAPPASGYTDIFDTTAATVYTVGDAVLGGNTNGEFIVDQMGSSGNIIAFGPGTYSGASISGGNPSVAMTAPDGDGLGTLALNVSAGTAVWTLPDSTTISLTSIPANAVVATPSLSDTTEEALLSYLADLGDTTIASALNTANFDYLNPTGSSYTVTGTVSGSNDTFTLTSSSAPDAEVTGMSGKTNTLDAYGDLTQDTISAIQYLDIDGSGNIALTGSEFGLSGVTIEGGGTVTIDTAGSYSSTGLSGNFNLTAGDWGGTVLTGDNHNGQTLTASLFGSDELDAGSGTGDVLIAGEGVDTLNGGSGGDTFKALNGLASGSSLTGTSTGNELEADGDISGATISGVQELDIGGSGGNAITLTAAQLAAFSSLNVGFVDTVNASGGGTYSVAGATDSDNLTMNTDAADNTTLTGDSAEYETLSAANSSGTDTLNAGTGNNGNLIANGSSGDDTLTATAGGGSQDNLSAQYSGGNDTLTAGNGSEVTLTVQYSSGNDTLTAGNGSDDTLSAQYSTGTDTLTVGSGTGDTLVAGDGVDTLTGSSAGYTLFSALDGLATGSSITGSGSGNQLEAGGDISGATISGVQTLDVYDSGSNSVILSHAEFAGFTTISGYGDTVIAATGGTYTLTSGDTVSTLMTDATDNTTLNANDAEGEILSAAGSTGTDTLNAGSGGDTLYSGLGVDALNGGAGDDTFNLGAGVASGTTVTGSGYGNAIVTDASDISGVTISGVTKLDDNSASLTLTSSQLSAFSTLVNASGSSETLAFASNGTYSLSGKSVSGAFTLDASATTGTVSLNTGSGNNTLIAGTGTDTLTGGAGFDVFVTGTGADTIYGGSYNNWVGVYGITLSSSTALIGGAGGNTLQIGGAYGDISQAYITGFAALDIDATVTLTASQLAGFSYIGSDYSTGGTIQAADADTYHLDYADIEQPVTFIAAVGGGTTVYAGGNAETFVTSAAGGDVIWAGTGNTVDVSANGIGGADNYIIMADGTVNFADNARADTYVTGTANTINAGADDTVGSDGGNDIYATGSGDAIWLFGYGGDVANISASGGNEVVYASSTGDTIHVSGNGVGGTDNYLNIVSGTVDYAANARADVYGASNTINAGNTDTVGIDGSSNTVNAGNGDAIWVSGGGTGVQINGGGSDSYYFSSGFGTDTIDNAATGGATSANGYVNLLSSISDEDLWFKQSGNDLVVDLLGTTNQITISNWYTSAGDQVSGFAANGLELDTAVSSLVSAMATYQSAHSGFDPTTATSMPTDTTLQSAIAASWHS